MRKSILPAIAAVALLSGAAFAQGTMTAPPSTNEPSARGDHIGAPGSPAPQNMPSGAQSTPGTMTTSTVANENDARKRIEAQGYTSVRDVRQDNSKTWRAKAMKDGKSVDLSLDSRGNVRSVR
jgi:hypothetical protein